MESKRHTTETAIDRAVWHVQCGIRRTKLALDKANSAEQREQATKALTRWKKMLELAIKKGPGNRPYPRQP
jgi:hypothetical protein